MADKLCCGSGRAFVEDPGCYLVFVVQRGVAVPEPAIGDALVALRDSATEWGVFKPHGLTIITLSVSKRRKSSPQR